MERFDSKSNLKIWLLKVKSLLYYFSLSLSIYIHLILCIDYVACIHQAILSLFPLLWLPLCPCSFSVKLSHTLKTNIPEAWKWNTTLGSALPWCLYASAPFSVCLICVDLYHFPLPLRLHLHPSLLFCLPWGVQVMLLKTNIPELYLQLICLKEKKRKKRRRKKPFNNYVWSSAVWGTWGNWASDEKMNRWNWLTNKKNVTEAGMHTDIETLLGFSFIFFIVKMYLHAFPRGLVRRVLVPGNRKCVCVPLSGVPTDINLIFL